MTLDELITDLKAAGANENTLRLAMNCYELGVAKSQAEWLHPSEDVSIGVDMTTDGATVVAMRSYRNGAKCVIYSQFHPATPREYVQFPTMLRRMWSGGDVQDWLDKHVNGEEHARH